jgi:hypothetical protein
MRTSGAAVKKANCPIVNRLCGEYSTNRTGGLQGLAVSIDRETSDEIGDTDLWDHMLAETNVLLVDLISELTSVAQNQDMHFTIDGAQLMERGQDKHGGLAHTTLGLTNDVVTLNCLGDALMLYYNSRVEKGDTGELR